MIVHVISYLHIHVYWFNMKVDAVYLIISSSRKLTAEILLNLKKYKHLYLSWFVWLLMYRQLEFLHEIYFQVTKVKKNLRLFNGFDFKKDEKEYTKRSGMLLKWVFLMYKTVTLSIVVFCSVNILVNPNIQIFFLLWIT